jgi:hypothetical protein
MRRRNSLPLLVAGAVVLIILAFVVVELGSPVAGPTGSARASGAGIAASDETTSPGNGPTATFSALTSAIANASSGATWSATATQSGGSPSRPVATPVRTAVATPVHTAVATPVATAVATRTPASSSPCPIFPASNVWNKDISKLPVAANSAAMIKVIGASKPLHPDFDAIGDGIPYNVVTSSTPKYTVSFDYADESDPGPYPIPASPKIEKGSDRHMLMLDTSACRLYELYDVSKSGATWHAGSGAIWNLRSNALRPAGWTSADAAGLPILPGLVLYSQVQSGVINHAIRFTAPNTCGYIYPARHQTAPPCPNFPPMGLRVRLKASVDISGFGPQARVVLTALKRYGMILADNGSPWYITGEPSTHWNDDQLHLMQTLTGADFEVVNTGSLRNG